MAVEIDPMHAVATLQSTSVEVKVVRQSEGGFWEVDIGPL